MDARLVGSGVVRCVRGQIQSPGNQRQTIRTKRTHKGGQRSGWNRYIAQPMTARWVASGTTKDTVVGTAMSTGSEGSEETLFLLTTKT